MDLDIISPVRTRGRANSLSQVEEVRQLEEADLALLEVERGIKAPSIKKIKDSHHQLARALASGMKPWEASNVTGYSASRISILQADPAFQDLLEFYRANQNAAYADLHNRLSVLSLDATEELQSRLEERPEEISSNLLVDIVKMTADRTGFGPQTKQTTLNVNIDLADRLAAARRRAGLGPREPVDGS